MLQCIITYISRFRQRLKKCKEHIRRLILRFKQNLLKIVQSNEFESELGSLKRSWPPMRNSKLNHLKSLLVFIILNPDLDFSMKKLNQYYIVIKSVFDTIITSYQYWTSQFTSCWQLHLKCTTDNSVTEATNFYLFQPSVE